MSLPLSVVDMLCAEIKGGILQGHHKPGAVLRQEDLAQQFDVSRVPIREALSRLEAEGYLLLRPRRGYSVSSLNPDEISEIFDLRMVIESHAGQIATKHRTDGDVHDVRRIVEAMGSINPDDPDYVTRWSDLNRDFHHRIIESCRRPRLLKVSLQLRDLVEPYIRLEMSMTGYSREPDTDHEEIAAAFAMGNADLVGALSAAHCGRTAARLLRSIREGESMVPGDRNRAGAKQTR